MGKDEDEDEGFGPFGGRDEDYKINRRRRILRGLYISACKAKRLGEKILMESIVVLNVCTANHQD